MRHVHQHVGRDKRVLRDIILRAPGRRSPRRVAPESYIVPSFVRAAINRDQARQVAIRQVVLVSNQRGVVRETAAHAKVVIIRRVHMASKPARPSILRIVGGTVVG